MKLSILSSDCMVLNPLLGQALEDFERETQAARYWNMRYHQIQEQAQEKEEWILDAYMMMREFCARVESGEVKSSYTYGKMRALLARADDGKEGLPL